MKKFFFLFLCLIAGERAYSADVKLSQLPIGSAASTNTNDSFPYVDYVNGVTKRLTLFDLINLPPIVSTYAPKASPVFTGTVSAPSFIGNLTGNVTGSSSGNLSYTPNQYGLLVSGVGNTVSVIAPSTSTAFTLVSGGSGASPSWAALGIAGGGTGQITKSTAFNALSPNTTLGDITYGDGSNSSTRLSGNTTSTKNFLTQTGNGSISSAPSWGTIAASDVPTLNQNTTGTAASFTGNLTGDVTSTAMATTIASNTVSNSKLAQMGAHTYKGNNSGSTANALDLTATQFTAELNALVGDSGSGGTKGLVPAPASGDAAAGKLLKANGTWGVGTVGMNAYKNAGTCQTAFTDVTSYTAANDDSAGGMNLTTGVYTFADAGRFLVIGRVTHVLTTQAAFCLLLHNGTVKDRAAAVGLSGQANPTALCSVEIKAVAGDTVKMQASTTGAATTTFEATNYGTQVTIVRVGD